MEDSGMTPRGGRRAGAGRPPRTEPKSLPIWCGQMSESDRALILERLTPQERFDALMGAVKGEREVNADEYGYNGWTNYATWNIPLWADNEYSLYTSKCEWLKDLGRTVTADDCREWVQEYMGGTTPDLKDNDWEGGRVQDVNWAEIAENWELERIELNADYVQKGEKDGQSFDSGSNSQLCESVCRRERTYT